MTPFLGRKARRWLAVLTAVLSVLTGAPGAAGAAPSPLNLSSPTQATQGTAYSYQFTVTGGTAPYTFEQTGGTLPENFSMSSTGLIAGQSCSPNGVYKFDVRVTDSSATPIVVTFAKVSINMTATPGACGVTVATSGLPATGTVGVAYDGTATASGGSAPYTYSIASGSVPTGLSLAANGTLSGTPTAAGTFSFQLRATDTSGNAGLGSVTMTISSPAITLSPGSLPTGTVGTAYSQTITATGGTGTYIGFGVSAGSLPAGISLDGTTGAISGTPTASGTSSVTITVTDSASGTGSASYSIVIAAAVPITVGPASLPDATIAVAYSHAVTAVGCVVACRFSASAGLPPGITLDGATGALAGTPSAAGPYTFTVTASEGANSGSKPFTLVVLDAIAVTPPSLTGGSVGTAYSATFGATGGTGTYSGFAVTSGALPAGLSLDGTSGTLSGTPTAAGGSAFTVTATDSASATGSRSYTLNVSAAPALGIQPNALPDGQPGVPYSLTFSAPGCAEACAFSAAGTLPPGLMLDASTGTLSGTPIAAGRHWLTISATDGFATGSRAYALAIVNGLSLGADLPPGTYGEVYAARLVASGGSGTYRFEVVGGDLPPGLALGTPTGAIFGVAQKAGTYAFTARVVDANGREATETFTIVVSGAALLTVDPETLPPGLESRRYESGLTAHGGTGPYRYAVASGALPQGVALDPTTGQVSGTPTTAGRYRFTIQATDADGNFGRRAYELVVESRPDPAQDAEVAGLVDSQMQAGVRFAQGQIDNVMQHLQASRSGFGCGVHQGVTVRISPNQAGVRDDSDLPPAGTAGALATPGTPVPARPQTALVPASGSSPACGESSSFALWTSGSLDYDSTTRDEFTSSGLTLGFDARLARRLVVGGAVGAGFDDGSFGTHGTNTSSNAVNVMAYASYRLGASLAVEAMGGWGRLDTDNRRFATLEQAILTSRRSGSLLYASIALGGDARLGPLSVSPYLRNDVMGIRLDGYQENASYALGFASTSQTVDVFVAGARVGYDARTSWGRIAPVVRMEYRHRFASSYTQPLFYVDQPETSYDLVHDGEKKDFVTAAAGIEAAFGPLVVGVEYGSSAVTFENFRGGTLRGTARLGF